MKLDRLEMLSFWGRSPSMDVSEHLAPPSHENRILFVESSDCRHVLNYISNQREYKTHIFIYEKSPALVARHILLIALSMYNQNKLGINEKTELFMELYGNLLIRHRTNELVKDMAKFLVEVITDDKLKNRNLPFFDFSHLKMKDIDEIEEILKSWYKQNEKVDAKKLWDFRLRNHLGERYDSRVNLYDWDFTMILRERNAEIINSRLYKKWRDDGIAFNTREDSYTFTNTTMMTTLSTRKPGYWGDIVTGPFIAFGIESKNKDLFEKSNGIYDKNAADITEINMRDIFEDISNIYGEKDDCDVYDIERNITITFLPVVKLQNIASRSKYQDLFNIIYFSCVGFKEISSFPAGFYPPECHLIVETCRFVVPFSKNDIKDIADNVDKECEKLNFKRQDCSNENWHFFSR